jgi:hypothetical protein
MSHNAAINLKVWCVLVCGVAILGMFIFQKEFSLCAHHNLTKGVIVETLPNDHLGIKFSYEIEGQSYEGQSTAGTIGRAFNNIQLGDSVNVFYDTKNPSTSTLDFPKVVFVGIVGLLVAACVVIPILIMCILHHLCALPEIELFEKCRPH